MKKLSIIIVITFTLALLSACGTNNTTTDTPAENTKITQHSSDSDITKTPSSTSSIQTQSSSTSSSFKPSIPLKQAETPEDIKKAEKTLIINHKITKNENGEFVISAKLENADTLEENITIIDFSENIVFEDKIELATQKLVVINGKAFPNEDIIPGTSGRGTDKKTSLTTTIMDVNITNKSENTDLYTVTLPKTLDISELTFANSEFKLNKSFIKLDNETVSVE